MNRIFQVSTRLAMGLILSGLAFSAVSHPLRGQELPWLQKGKVRLDFAPSFWSWDSRYGLNPEGAEEEELLGLDLTGSPMGSGILPDLVDLETSLAEAMEDPSYRMSLGFSRAYIDQSRLVLPFRLELGITDWLTIGGMVPMVRPRTEMTFSLDADSLTATDGTSPFQTDAPGVINFLDAIRSTLLEAQASHPDDPAVLETEAYLNALSSAYVHGTFFPAEGSAPGRKLQARLENLTASLQALGYSGMPQTIPLAPGYLDEEEFQTFLGGRVMRAHPLEDYSDLWSIGDVEITANVRIFRRGFEADSLGNLPRVRFQVGGGVLVRLGMGEQADPSRFFSQDIGDGQMDMEGNAFGLLEVGRRFGAWGQLRYGIQGEGEIFRRITHPDNALPNYKRTAPLTWTPGNYLDFEVNPRVFLNPAISFGVRYHFWNKGADSYALGAINPEGQDPALLPDPGLLNLETEETLQEIGLSAAYSTVEAAARGEASMPLDVRAGYYHPLGGSGGQTPKGGRFRIGVTIYKTLWGGDGSEPAPEGPAGR